MGSSRIKSDKPVVASSTLASVEPERPKTSRKTQPVVRDTFTVSTRATPSESLTTAKFLTQWLTQSGVTPESLAENFPGAHIYAFRPARVGSDETVAWVKERLGPQADVQVRFETNSCCRTLCAGCLVTLPQTEPVRQLWCGPGLAAEIK